MEQFLAVFLSLCIESCQFVGYTDDHAYITARGACFSVSLDDYAIRRVGPEKPPWPTGQQGYYACEREILGDHR